MAAQNAHVVAYVYALLDENTHHIRYVGCSKDARLRARQHWNDRMKVADRNGPLCAWLCSLSTAPAYVVLQVVPWEERFAAERYWTDLLKQAPGIDLLNIYSGSTPPPEIRARISASLNVAYLSPRITPSSARPGGANRGQGMARKSALH